MEGSCRDDNNTSNRSSKKRGRGSTKLKKLTLHHGTDKKLHVEFDDDKRPIGPDGDRFISYIGLLARSKVGILFPRWKLVPQATKDMIWDDILLTYDIPPTLEMKKYWLQQIRDRWKDFKSMLTRVYIRGDKKNEDPCSEYKFLDQETWREFVKSREDPEFQKLSDANKERQSKNQYPHYMSRGGYRKLEHKIMQHDLKEMEEAAKLDPHVVVHPLARPTRQRKWKEARVKKGQYITPAVATVAKMIDSLEEQEAQGSFTPSGRMDILAASIGKPDYPGRVRGVGKGVGLKQYFGPISRNSPEMISREEFHGLLAKVKEETQAEVCQKLESLMAELRDEFKSMVANMVAGQGAERTPQVSHTVQSTKDSCSPPKTLTLHAPSPTLDDGAPCYLYLEQTKKQVVAQARAYMLGSTSNNMLGSTIHHEEIQEDQVRVMVVVVLEANAKVPFPIDEIVEVGQAKDAFILWPKRLIDMEMTLPMDPKTVEKFPCLAQLHEFFKAMTNAIDLKMPTGIMGSEKSYPFKIDKKDLMEFIFMKELDMSWANLTILYLHNLCIAMGKDNLYGFLCPNSLQLAHNTLDQRIIYVSNTIRESKLPCYLAPIIQGSHWSLCVACPFDNVVYWFCSLGSTPSEEMKGVLNTALKIYYMMGGKCNENKDSTTWIYPKCPQQVRSTECGYYVIHYMHEIVQFDSTAKLQEFFDNNDPCTSENIDVIRNALAQQILQELSAQKLGVQLS